MTRALFSVIALAAIAGCNGTVECDSGEELDTATGECLVPCTNSMVSGSEFPTQGSTNAYYRTSIEARLNDAESDATITVSTGGTEVPGTVSVDDKRIIFSPTDPLAPSTTYDVTLNFSCANPTWQVTTSEVGGTTVADDLVGDTFSLDLASGRFVQPEGVGPLLQEYLTTAILINVQSVDGTDIQMIGAVAEDDGSAQAECSPTIPFPKANFSDNPYFQVGPETTTLSIEGYTVTIDDLFVSGAFAPDGSYISGAVLKGAIDTRPLVPLLNEEGEPDEICNLAGTIGVSCEECPNDNMPFCLSLEVDSIAAEGVDLAVQAQHTPAETNPAEGSTNICDITACAGESECTAR